MTTLAQRQVYIPTNGHVNGGNVALQPAALYGRESDPRQGQSTLDAGRAYCERFAQDEGYYAAFYVTDSMSGLLARRPGYQEAQRLARSGLIKAVIVYKFDRLGRDLAEYFRVRKEFKQLGVKVLSATERGLNELGEDLVIVMAQETSRQISAHTTPKKRYKAEQGFWNAKPIPGYDVARLMPDGSTIPSKTATKEQKKASLGAVLVRNDKADVVIEAFRRYAAGEASLYALVDYMRANDVPITRSGVWLMLRNRAYIGRVVYGTKPSTEIRAAWELEPELDTEGKHVALIAEDTFARVQAQLDINRKMARAAAGGAKHLLSGILTCGECGARMSPHVTIKNKGRSYLNYRCKGRDGWTKATERCRASKISARKLHPLVTERLREALEPFWDADTRQEAIERIQGDAGRRRGEIEAERAALERREAELDRELAEARRKVVKGTFDDADYSALKGEIEAERAEIQRKLDALPKPVRVDAADALAALDSIEDWSDLTDGAWRHLLVNLTEGVVWRNGEAQIRWKPEYAPILGG